MLGAGVNVAVGAAFNGIGTFKEGTKIAELGGLKAVVGEIAMSTMFVKAGMSALQTYTSGVASSMVGAIGSDDYWGVVKNAAWSTDALANVASVGAGSLAGDLLGELDLKDGNAIVLNGHTFDTKSIQNLNNFAGSLAGAGLGYAISGEMTLNVLNFGFLADGEDTALNRILSTGLLEMRFGGKDGFSLSVGSGGTDVSFGTVATAMAGLKDAAKVTGAKLAELAGNRESLDTLNAVNMLGWTGEEFEQGLAKRIWEEELEVVYADMDAERLGKYTQGDNFITINKTMLGGGKEGSAKLASVMSHEGTHVAGIRIEGLAYLQGSSTYETVTAMFGLQGDDAFRGKMDAAIHNPKSWTVNSGDTDYWDVYLGENFVFQYMDNKDPRVRIVLPWGINQLAKEVGFTEKFLIYNDGTLEGGLAFIFSGLNINGGVNEKTLEEARKTMQEKGYVFDGEGNIISAPSSSQTDYGQVDGGTNIALHRNLMAINDMLFNEVSKKIKTSIFPILKQEKEGIYPPNNGAVPGLSKEVYIQPGTILGRYGEIGTTSKYLTLPGIASGTLSLPEGNNTSIYQEFMVLKGFPATKGVAMEWPQGSGNGGGIQILTRVPIEKLNKGATNDKMRAYP
jgi:hypothetical protein